MIKLLCEERSFLLRVLACEFPEAKEPDDAGWLVIEVEAEDKGAYWRSRGAFIRAQELVALYQWLGAIVSGNKAVSEISFTEGELVFRFEPNDGLIIFLDFALHPKGCRYDYANDVAFSMRFRVSDIEISFLMKNIEEDIKKFPMR
ncbi:WapI family immunity protein [Phytopseudomonas dryadis]|uniref:WapI family immunity protein n=1 Tax=Phytopseudomonas dryadis TaxID=2487520 RepID=UPI0010383F91|nr:hypothetical protein [Pseudomonas dryadis]